MTGPRPRPWRVIDGGRGTASLERSADVPRPEATLPLWSILAVLAGIVFGCGAWLE